MVSDTSHFEKWADACEQSLISDARTAGILEHGSQTGDARELLVAKGLRSVLPTTIEIGRGSVISSTGAKSAQIDVVLYDSRYPRLVVSDNATLYPIEGVIATVEVKSTLDAQSVYDAMDNCASVLALGQDYYISDIESEAKRVSPYFMNYEDAKWNVLESMTPRTYVYAFQGFKKSETLGEHIRQWVMARSDLPESYVARPPSMIVGGGTMAIHTQRDWGGRVEFEGGRSPGPPLAAVWECETSYALFISHLLTVAHNHFDAISHGQLRRTTRKYCDFLTLFQKRLGRVPCSIVGVELG